MKGYFPDIIIIYLPRDYLLAFILSRREVLLFSIFKKGSISSVASQRERYFEAIIKRENRGKHTEGKNVEAF